MRLVGVLHQNKHKTLGSFGASGDPVTMRGPRSRLIRVYEPAMAVAKRGMHDLPFTHWFADSQVVDLQHLSSPDLHTWGRVPLHRRAAL